MIRMPLDSATADPFARFRFIQVQIFSGQGFGEGVEIPLPSFLIDRAGSPEAGEGFARAPRFQFSATTPSEMPRRARRWFNSGAASTEAPLRS